MRSSIILAIAATFTSCLAAMTSQVWRPIGDIAAIDTDKYAIVGSIRGHYNYTHETIYTVEFYGNVSSPSIELVATFPDATMLNELASLPAYPQIILARDSRLGAVYPTPLGINGIKILGRIPITEVGYKAGNADVVTYSNSPNKYDWGHFIIDPAGNIFAAQTPNAFVQIFPDETYMTLAGGGNSI
ncbi:putative SMP-30/Gluconolactonase/LRE-like region domain-containing protein [Seiridium unicorne]|uniref:SMP-30/Gluconolactonase/LRE-like region domain-containing protein n=1 Tax=Seiridium unicorne TaxID=138068 RepID=A0ABR2VA52_9PEZI